MFKGVKAIDTDLLAGILILTILTAAILSLVFIRASSYNLVNNFNVGNAIAEALKSANTQ